MSEAGDNAVRPIIKKKKVVQGGGHHGGAWKVAYADFVTAMMAFFLLMWLLNATTEKQRKGLADYFAPSIAINRVSGGGDGDFGGDSVFTEETLAQNGSGASNRHPSSAQAASGQTGGLETNPQSTDEDSSAQLSEELQQVEDVLLGRSGESEVADELMRHITTRVTDEGLIVELFDLEEARLFEGDTATPTPLLRDLAGVLVSAADLVVNDLAIEGHTHARAVVVANAPVWDITADRANVMRVLMKDRGLDRTRVDRVTGHADRRPAVRNPVSIRNNRLEVIFLRSDVGDI
ncbi:MAG: flagellar motor protein MotB [Pseudomonadota bacterium]